MTRQKQQAVSHETKSSLENNKLETVYVVHSRFKMQYKHFIFLQIKICKCGMCSYSAITKCDVGDPFEKKLMDFT